MFGFFSGWFLLEGNGSTWSKIMWRNQRTLVAGFLHRLEWRSRCHSNSRATTWLGKRNLVKYVWLIILVVLFGCLFPPPILWEHLSEIESEWELLSDTSPPLCESIWVHFEQLWVNKSLDRRKSHWISLVPFGCNWGHLSNWSINN